MLNLKATYRRHILIPCIETKYTVAQILCVFNSPLLTIKFTNPDIFLYECRNNYKPTFWIFPPPQKTTSSPVTSFMRLQINFPTLGSTH